MKTQSMTDACPNYLDIPSRMLLAYLPIFGSLTQFGHPSVDDRLNCGSSESRGKHAVIPRSEQQTVTLNRTQSSFKLRVQTQHMSDIDLGILLSIVVGVDGYDVGRFGVSIHNHSNRVKLAASQRQAHNEVHTYVIPLPCWNAQWL
jgi:hypothetical protein